MLVNSFRLKVGENNVGKVTNQIADRNDATNRRIEGQFTWHMTTSIWLPNYPYHKNNRLYQTIDLLNRNQVISKSPAIEWSHSVL